MMNRLQVYLDSSDFSLLSDPRRLNVELRKLRDQLQFYADQSLVQFRFSMAHVCEAAPTGVHARESAQRRAEMMYRLCGSNTLVTIAEIIEAEALGVKGFLPFTNGRWYPSLGDLLPESPLADMECAIDEAFKEQGLNRQQRRQKKREVLGRRGLKGIAGKAVENSLPGTMSELLAVLPLEQSEIQVLVDFFRTGQGREQAMNACHRALANPTFIMQRFASDFDKLDGVTEWLRQGGIDFAEKLGSSTSAAQDLLRAFTLHDIAKEAEIEEIQNPVLKAERMSEFVAEKQTRQALVTNSWNKMQKSMLVDICTRIAEKNGVSSAKDATTLLTQCPGISTAIAIFMYAAKRSALPTESRTLSASDFGDAMHGIYAPYVDIFRTDVFMADAVAKAVKLHGTKVARRLSEVPSLIEQHLHSAVAVPSLVKKGL